MRQEKVYKVHYAKKGTNISLGYFYTRAKTKKDAIQMIKSYHANTATKPAGAIQRNKYFKSLKYYVL